ncbi:MAG: HK97 family phage prohead protease [Chloroflexi bacterium]|nr:HK97 family phage prohead protease [Chloroflexota bacterium]
MTGTGLGLWERERLLEALDAYQRGLSDAPLLHKWTESQAGGSENEDGLPMAFVISTDEVDRHGDVIMAQGWRLDAYRNNPVFLWAHDYARPVIGRAVEVWQEPHRLLAKMKFAPTEFAQEVAMLYRAGYQRGVSVGFKPLRYEERRDEKTGAFLGIRFLEQELLETSAVPVPANRNALRRALDQAPVVGEYLRLVDAIGNAAEAPSGNINRAAVCAHEGIWPELAARVDDISKLVGELAQMLEEADQLGDPGAAVGQLDQVLSLIRQARA